MKSVKTERLGHMLFFTAGQNAPGIYNITWKCNWFS